MNTKNEVESSPEFLADAESVIVYDMTLIEFCNIWGKEAISDELAKLISHYVKAYTAAMYGDHVSWDDEEEALLDYLENLS